MTRRLTVAALTLSLFLALAAAATEADAARMGGGKSFGGKSSYSQSYSKPSAPAKDAGGMQSQSQTPGRNPAGGGFMSRFGGLGGILGGMLLGGMIGSLLSGGGFAFPGILEILLIGGGLWLLFRFLRARRPAVQGAGPQAAYSWAGASRDSVSPPPQAAGWGGISAQPAPGPQIPADFDREEFLAGAKAAYARLQASWDRRDMEDLARFCSAAVMAELREQARRDPAPGRTEILMVNAELLEVRREGSETTASALFDALLRENPEDRTPAQVREVWHFRRDESAPGDHWTLDGIQQLET